MADNLSEHEAQNSNTTLLQKLASAVDGHAATATFACGGSLPVGDFSAGECGPDTQNLVPSITLRWDARNAYSLQSKVVFPLADRDNVSRQMFNDLLHHCDPATFGVGGRDVLDEEYRKAAKLDPSDFSTNFHPHDCGILDSIQQILPPSTVRGGQGIGIGPEGVRAELYKLNIYSAPSGGVLRIKHRGETVDFAWGDTSQQSVQWAAFYGDCEHEVLEVTKGHRVTLTYNLHYSSVGKLAQPVSNPHHLPLFDIAREMLLQPQFMRQGGILGFYCHHQYAHSHQSGRRSIPGAFKGVDLAVFSVFSALGLNVGIHPIIENKSENMGGLSAKELLHGPTISEQGDFVENCIENLGQEAEDKDEDDDVFNDYKEDYTTIVGTKLHGPIFVNNYEEESTEPVTDNWPHKKVPQIIWMNDWTHKDFAYAGLAYGNEAELSYKFSAAAILVVVPSSSKRNATKLPSHPAPVFPKTETTASHGATTAAYDQSANVTMGSSYADPVDLCGSE